ncbi:MAG: hypothetical protein ACYC7F_06765, partial [Gemmatimonadaceae bacterium]
MTRLNRLWAARVPRPFDVPPRGLHMASNKVADLAGPGVSTYPEVEKILPTDYQPLLGPKETQHAVTAIKRYIEDGLCRELNL